VSGLTVAELVATLGIDDQGFGTGLDGLLGKFGPFEAGGVAALAGIAGGFAGAGLAALHFGEEFDSAYDGIRIATGKTGDALAGLEADFRQVVSSVPTDFASASTAIGDLNRRLDITGEQLQERSEQFLELSRITGTDVAANIRDVTRLYGDWSVAGERQAATLDMLYRASQQSGLSVSELSTVVVDNGATLRQLGFDLEGSITMFSKFEKEGVNASKVIQGFGQLNKYATKEGRDGIEVWNETVKAIQSSTEAKAKAIGQEVFGVRAANDMVAAIREQRFSYEDLEKSIVKGSDTIAKAADDTADWRESLTLLKNKALVELEPMLSDLFGALGKGVDAFAGLDEGTQKATLTVAAAVAAIGPLVYVGNALVAAYGSLAAAAATAAASQATLTASQVAGSLATGALLGETTALRTAMPLMSGAGVAGLGAIGIAAGALLWKLKDIHDETMDIYAEVDALSDQVTEQINRLGQLQRARPEGVTNRMTRRIQDQIMKVTVETNGTADLSKLEAKMALFKRFAKFEYPGFSSLTLDIKTGKLKGADLTYTFNKLRTEIIRQLHVTEREADQILSGIFGKKYKAIKMPKVNTSAWDRLPTEFEKNTELVAKVANKNGAAAAQQLIAAFQRANRPAPYSVSAAKAAQAIRTQLDALPGYGQGLGANLANSVAAGISSATDSVAARAEQMVRMAIARAKQAADARSPSRKMIAFGRDDMAGGFALGLLAGIPRVASAAEQMIGSAMGPGGRAVSAGPRQLAALGPINLTARLYLDGEFIQEIAVEAAQDVAAGQSRGEVLTERATRAGY
jgi:hypothetical protein